MAARGVLRGGSWASTVLRSIIATRARHRRGLTMVSACGKKGRPGKTPANATTPRGYLHLACNARGLDDPRRRHNATKWLRFSARRPTVVTERRRRLDGARARYGAAAAPLQATLTGKRSEPGQRGDPFAIQHPELR
jgi:hypothetical protein